jgi:hypothetical protein
MRVLTLAGFLWAFAVVTVPVFSAIGKPHIETNYNILRLVVLFALLYPFIKLWGMEAVCRNADSVLPNYFLGIWIWQNRDYFSSG